MTLTSPPPSLVVIRTFFLVCRDTTERPETIDCGLGKLIDTQITENIEFFNEEIINILDNPYGTNVCEKIITKL